MWQPSEQVAEFSNLVAGRYAGANRCVNEKLDILANLASTFPEVYLQFVFYYFRDSVLNPAPAIIQAEEPFYPLLPYEMIAYLITFLRDFGWLPARYVELPYNPDQYANPADYAAVYRDRRNFRWMWDLYLENPFYQANIRARRPEMEVELPGGQQYLHLFGDTPFHTNGLITKAFSTQGPMLELLLNGFIRYVVWLKETRLHEDYDYAAPGPLQQALVYQTRISFAVTLFDHFRAHLDLIYGMMNRLSAKMAGLTQHSLQILNDPVNVAHRYDYINRAYDVLRQSARFVALSQEPLGHTYLFYLKRLEVLQDGWNWHYGHLGVLPQAPRHYATPVVLDSLLDGSIEFLQSFNLLPSPDNIHQPWTNGMLIELLVEHLENPPNQQVWIKSRWTNDIHEQVFSINPFDVRNRLIWFVSVATGWWHYLLSEMDQQTRRRRGVPMNYDPDYD